MPTEKIKDAPKPCFNPEHNPPTHQVFSPGTYHHTCPSCGHTQEFVVQAIYA